MDVARAPGRQEGDFKCILLPTGDWMCIGLVKFPAPLNQPDVGYPRSEYVGLEAQYSVCSKSQGPRRSP